MRMSDVPKVCILRCFGPEWSLFQPQEEAQKVVEPGGIEPPSISPTLQDLRT